MHLSQLERDILSDLAQDSHELWEIYAFVRSARVIRDGPTALEFITAVSAPGPRVRYRSLKLTHD